MHIQQKKAAYTLTFTFNEDTLNYRYKSSNRSGDYDIHYEDFPSKFSKFTEEEFYCKIIGITLLAASVACQLKIYSSHSWSPAVSLIISSGLVCLGFGLLNKINFTIFETPQRDVLIIKDKKHDEIFDEINLRRKQQLLKLYGEINLDNTPEDEIEKFKWLEKEKVITQEEAEQKINKVKQSVDNNIGFNITK